MNWNGNCLSRIGLLNDESNTWNEMSFCWNIFQFGKKSGISHQKIVGRLTNPHQPYRVGGKFQWNLSKRNTLLAFLVGKCQFNYLWNEFYLHLQFCGEFTIHLFLESSAMKDEQIRMRFESLEMVFVAAITNNCISLLAVSKETLTLVGLMQPFRMNRVAVTIRI